MGQWFSKEQDTRWLWYRILQWNLRTSETLQELFSTHSFKFNQFKKIKLILTEIFDIIISDGKGIENNTSSLHYGLSDLKPSIDILKLYKELVGTIITIGSDSYKPEHLGNYIDETKDILKELDFSSFCTYNKM